MISLVSIENFLIHKNRKFEFAPGVTLLTGENGRGKTTLVQALVWAIWGQKLRPLGDAASVRLETSQGPLWRRTGHAELVDFSGVKNSNKTKATATIESHFGSYASWQRSLYITGRTVSSFSSATPKGRWDHLMRLLGAEIFDKAIAKTTQRLRSCEQLLNTRRHTLNYASERLSELSDKIDESAEEYELVSGGPDTNRTRKQIEAKDSQMAELEARAASCAKNKKSYLDSGEVLAAEAAVQSAKQVLAALPETSCFVCGQRTPNPEYVSVTATLTAAKERLGLAYRAVSEFEAITQSLASEYRILRSEKEKLEAELREAIAVEKSFLNVEGYHVTLLHDYIKTFEEVDRASVAYERAELQVTITKTAQSVLQESKKIYISNFCSEIEQLTNRHLGFIGAKHRVTLALLDGALNIQTSGTGAESYESCSSGEQRRIDICMLLAMSQVAASIGNLTQAAPLVIDEALDTLDETGVEALLLLACDIAKRRQVILVSHAMPPLPQGINIHHLDLNSL